MNKQIYIYDISPLPPIFSFGGYEDVVGLVTVDLTGMLSQM